MSALALRCERHSTRTAQPVRAVVPGQSAAFYAGERLLAGGVIERAVDRVRRIDYGRDIERRAIRRSSGMLGGLTLAVSYWHIAVSRLGQRPILVPLVSIPIFWFFLKKWPASWFLSSTK